MFINYFFFFLIIFTHLFVTKKIKLQENENIKITKEKLLNETTFKAKV